MTVSDLPGRVRLVVDEDDAENQQGLIWSFRSRYYDSASTAAVRYEAEALQALDTATKPALTGASGGTVVTHGTLATSWTPVMGTNIGGTSYLTHRGTYQVYARVYSTSGTTVQTRFVWDVGDLVNPVENASWRLPGASNFYVCDYGEVRLDEATVGTHRWQGQIQAKGDVGTEKFSVDKLWFVNKDEGMGKLSAPISLTEGLTTYSARSNFNTESGAITGDSLSVGGSWAAAGDATDFAAAGGVATRSEVSDASDVGHYGLAGTAMYGVIVVGVDVKHSAAPGPPAPLSGVFLRYVDTNNNLQAVFALSPTGNKGVGYVRKRVGGPTTYLANQIPIAQLSVGGFARIEMYCDAAGRWSMYINGGMVAQGADADLATGGTLDDGRIGMYDEYSAASPAVTRTYDNFVAWVPPSDAVAFSSQSVELGTQGITREDSTGTASGPVSIVTGDLPRIPPSGAEGRSVEVFVKMSRGDLDELPDSGIDDLSARIAYRPSWLQNPGS